MRIDWVGKLQNGLQVAAYGLGIATIQYAFLPGRQYGVLVAYSLAISVSTWALIDLTRGFFPSARETGWPQGWAGVALVFSSIVVGFLLGNFVADQACQRFGLYTGPRPSDPAAELRTSILITALAGIAGSYYFYAQNKGAYLQRKMAEARSHADEARLKLLETQLEPHMLFNTLANLRALIGVDPARAQQMLDHMIAYLRATLAASRSTTHSAEVEFERLRDYLELMAIRMGPRLQYDLQLPPQLAQRKLPTLLLQPLVENSIKHGLEPKVGGGRITVSARADGDALVLEVADTGVGEGPGPGAGRGFGLQQIRERLTTLYGDKASFDFKAVAGEGATATITIRA